MRQALRSLGSAGGRPWFACIKHISISQQLMPPFALRCCWQVVAETGGMHTLWACLHSRQLEGESIAAKGEGQAA